MELSDAAIGFRSAGGGVTEVLNVAKLRIEAGEFVLVCGRFGSGKSSLLSVLAGAAPLLEGTVLSARSRAFVPQKCFLFNGNLRENILFGLPFDEKRYDDVLRRTALSEDLECFPQKDLSTVGENGVQLSGGQKTRVGLARALYSDADVYFFDDVMSAVDSHTGKHIWEHVLVWLHKHGRTVILVTHQLQYLSHFEVDRVLLLKYSTIFLNGAWDDIMDQAGEEILRFTTEARSEEASIPLGEPAAMDLQDPVPDGSVQQQPANVPLAEMVAEITELLRHFKGRPLNELLISQVASTLTGSTTDDETKHFGLIAWVDFKVYLKVFGTAFMIAMLAACAVGSAALAIVQNVWLAVWSDTDKASQKYLIVYAAIGCGSAVTVAMQTIVLTLCALRASRALHSSMLDTLIDAPVRFFDANPVGRIQNRFLQDLANVDNFVPNSLLDVTTKTLNIFSQVALVLLFAPWVALVLPILLPLYYAIFTRVRCAARDTRRIESVAHSPCYTLFGDMLSGRSTIASFRAESRFERLNLQLVVEMATAKYGNEAVCKWAQALTTQTGCALYCAVGIVCVALNHFDLLSASHLGLVMLYASTLQRAMMDYMMCLTTLETQFVSVHAPLTCPSWVN